MRREQWRHERFGRIVRQLKERADKREAQLLAELALIRAQIRDLRQRVFGRKSEQGKGVSEQQRGQCAARVPRGQRHGTRGHGRTMQSHLSGRSELVALDTPQCPQCGLALEEFPGTQDSEVLEIEVKAYRRVIRRQRYKCVCQCGCLPGIVTAPAPANLIERGKFGVSIWSTVLLDKFLYGRPSARLLQDLAGHGLNMSPGTLAGGLQALAPLFEPLEQALVAKLRSQAHWHADETRWAVFVEIEGKVGHRWYMWVFHSPSVVHYVLDQSRATQVVQDELAGVQRGIISCDRYAAYKKFARLNPGVVLAFCWAHVRRDYLEIANAWPDLSKWAMGWVDAIGALYHLNNLRLGSAQGSTERAGRDDQLQRAVQAMASQMDAQMGQIGLSEPALKVLTSMIEPLGRADGVCPPPVGAHGQQYGRTGHPHTGHRAQEFLWLIESLVGPTGRDDVQLVHDGKAVETQPQDLADCLPAGLRRERRASTTRCQRISSLGDGHQATRCHARLPSGRGPIHCGPARFGEL